MPGSKQATTHLILISVMTASFLGLLYADVFVSGYTVRLLVLLVPIGFIFVILGIEVPTPWGKIGGNWARKESGGDDE